MDRRLIAALASVLTLVASQDGSAQTAPTSALNSDPAKVQSGDYELTREHGRMVWSVSHLGFSNYAGLLTESNARLHLDAKVPAKSRLEASVKLASVVTGLPAFDDRLRGESMLDTAKFPTAEFRSTAVQRTAPTKARVTGELSFMGVTRPAVLDVTFNQSGIGPGKAYRVGFDGRMTIKRSDWGMTRPAGIGDLLTLTIEADFVQAKP